MNEDEQELLEANKDLAEEVRVIELKMVDVVKVAGASGLLDDPQVQDVVKKCHVDLTVIQALVEDHADDELMPPTQVVPKIKRGRKLGGRNSKSKAWPAVVLQTEESIDYG